MRCFLGVSGYGGGLPACQCGCGGRSVSWRWCGSVRPLVVVGYVGNRGGGVFSRFGGRS